MAGLLSGLFGYGTDEQGQITSPGLLGGIGRGLQNNSDMLMQMGMGMMSGKNGYDNWANAAQGMALGSQMDTQRQLGIQKQIKELAQKKAAEQYATQLPENLRGLVMANPDMASKFASADYEKLINPDQGQLVERNGKTYRVFKNGSASEVSGLPGQDQTPEFQKKIEYYKNMPEGPDKDAAGAMLGITKGGGEASKIAERYKMGQTLGLQGEDLQRYSLTGNIPTNTEKAMPSEVAGRVAMADSYLKEAPTVRQAIARGDVTGVWDGTLARNGFGEGAKVYRQIQSGVDALRRGLTGAGMGESEANEYAQRYLPTARDTADQMLDKHDRLVKELEDIKEAQIAGRQYKTSDSAPQGVGAAPGALPAKGQTTKHAGGGTITRID